MKPWPWLLLPLLLACSSLPSTAEEPLDEEARVTAERTFALRAAQVGAALPEGLTLTVQVVTSGSASKPGWKAARARLVYQGVEALTVNLRYELVAQVQGSLLPQVSRTSSILLDPQPYPTGRVSRSRTTPYQNPEPLRAQGATWCAVVRLAEAPVDSVYEVCEPPASPDAVRAALEPLAGRVRLFTDGPQDLRFVSFSELPPPGFSYPPQRFEDWVTPYLHQPDPVQARAWKVFAAELRRWFGSGLQVYIEELPCHNCHTFALALVGDGGGWYGGYLTAIVWDSALR